MLKLTTISMLSGLVALLAGIHMLYVSPNATGQRSALVWDAGTARVDSGTGTRIGKDLRVNLDKSGRGVIALPFPRFHAGSFPFLHLGIAPGPKDLSVLVLWRSAQTGPKVHVYALPEHLETASWIDTKGLTSWSGDITSLGVAVSGRPGSAITFTDVSLLPASLPNQLQSIYSNWTSFVPWGHSSINTHKAIGPTGSLFYPVVVTAAWLTLSTMAYVLILLLPRTKASFDWRVVAAMFLTCWLGLDLLWQGKLFRQLALTQETFSGRDSQDKLAVGIDGELVRFMAEVTQKLDATDSRVFVSSSDDYLGMRGAYYLYPLNVYWERHGPELPQTEYLHSGDYIVLVQPADTAFDASTGALLPRREKPLHVEPILTRHMGSLYRVK